MCEHCHAGKVWVENMREGETDICEWSVPENEDPEMCPNPATHILWDRHVENHLCPGCVDLENQSLDQGLGGLYRQLDLQDSVDYLPINRDVGQTELSCDQFIRELLLEEKIQECGKPASHAKMVIEHYSYCLTHIRELGY